MRHRAGSLRASRLSIRGPGFGGGFTDFSGGVPEGFDFGPAIPEPITAVGITGCEQIGNPVARAACLAAIGLFGGGDADPEPLVDPGGDCPIFTSPNPITGRCEIDLDPGPGTGLPGGNGAAGRGLTRPSAVSRRVLECPRFADGKTGILWMNALTGDVVCLPRRTSGRGFGLIRKNKPRKKAFISAAQKKSLDDIKRVQGKAKKFAEDAGFSCKKR